MYGDKMDINKKCVIDIETNGDPWTGRIISIGIMDVNSREITIFYEENEEILLMHFLQFFNKNGFNHIIGFNVSYDIRFIFSKCLKYRLTANGFFKAPTTDLMVLLKKINTSFSYNRPGQLSEWGKLIGKNKMLKSAPVPILFQQKKMDEILAYNKNDLELTYELWKRIRLVLDGYSNGD